MDNTSPCYSFVIVAATVLAANGLGCGTRSGLDPHAPVVLTAAPPADAASPPHDAAVTPPALDASTPSQPPDAATAPLCARLAALSDPVVVHADHAGAFRRLALVRRDADFDAAATFEPETDDRVPTAVVRRVRLDRAGAVAFGATTPLATAAFARYAPVGSQLGACVPAAGGGLALARWFRYEPVAPPVVVYRGPTDCQGVALAVDTWLFAFHAGSRSPDPGPTMVGDVSLDGTALGPARPALQRVASNLPVTVAAIDRGYAWASRPDERGTIELALRFDGTEVHTELGGFLPNSAPPGLAAWSTDGTQVALGAHTASGLVVIVVDRAGHEVVRSPRLEFDMGAENTPALVPLRAGVAVAQLAYGDDSPTNGVLAVRVLDRPTGRPFDGAVRVNVARPDTRPTDVVGAAVDDNVVVLHWAGTRSGSPQQPATFTMAVGCQ